MTESSPGGASATALKLISPRRVDRDPPRDESYFRQILDQLPAAIYTTDAAGRITYYNEAAVALWGCRPELGESEWCGSWKLFWPDGRALPHGECPMAMAIKEQCANRGMEAVAERPDGTRVPFVPYPTPLFSASGEFVGAVNMLVDISDRKRADELSERMAGLVASSYDAIITTDLDGAILSWNTAAERLFGYSASEVVGNSGAMLVPAERADEEPGILERIRRGERVEPYETVRRRQDGSLIDISITVSPIKDAEGRIIGASKIARDISERKRSEDSARRLTSIVESSDDAIISKNLNGIIQSWNAGAGRLFGYTADEVVGKSVTILIPEDRLGEEEEILARLQRGERIDHFETIRRRKDGSLLDVSLTVSPVRNADGKIIGASKIARDITEYRRTQEQQQLLLREMNHRIKNLFTLAGGVVALSARTASTPSELAASIRERLGALARAHALTLSVSTGDGASAERPTMLHALIGTIVSAFESPDVNKRHIAVSGPDIALSGSVMTSFALLLHEFATNAAKFGALSTPTGRVDIRCSEAGDRFILQWTERGGPRIEGPASAEGFGSLLARASVERQLGGEIAREWQPEGLTIRLSIARDRLTGS